MFNYNNLYYRNYPNTFYKNNNIAAEDVFPDAENRNNKIKSGKPHAYLPVNCLEYCFEDGM